MALLAGCGAPADHGIAEAADDAVPHCVGKCGRVVDGSPDRAREPFLVVDPNDSRHIVIAYTTYPTDPSHEPFSLSRASVSVSVDGGETWTMRAIPSGADPGSTAPLSAYTSTGYAIVLAFLPDGTLVMSAAANNNHLVPGFTPGWAYYTSRSTDGGHTWGDDRIVDSGEGAKLADGDVGVDETAMYRENAGGAHTVGPDGALLFVWTQLTRRHLDNGFEPVLDGRLVSSTSTDGGLTWSAKRIIDDEGQPYGASPVWGRDSSLRVAYIDRAGDLLRFAESHDRGQTWDARTLGPTSWHPMMRVQTLASGAERLLVAYTTRESMGDVEHQAELMWSDDGGSNWSAPLIVDAPEGEGAPTPDVAGAKDGDAWVTFFDVDAQGRLRYLVLKVVDGIAGTPLILDEIEGATANGLGISMGLASTQAGDALAAWVTYNHETGFDIVWAHVTAGAEYAPVATPDSLVGIHPRPAPPAGLADPIEYAFPGHVNFPGCYAEADPALDAAVRDRVEFEFEVPANTRFVNATLDWETQQPVADLDLYLYNSERKLFRGDDGVPEKFSFEITESDQGTWTGLVQNCENAPTDFTLELVLS